MYEHESQCVQFEDASDHYVFRPHRIFPFEGCRQIYNFSYGRQPEALLAVSNSTHGVPTQSGPKDLWRYNGNNLIRVHTRPRKGLSDPLSTASKDFQVDPAKLKPLSITKIAKEGDLLPATQRDENFKADSGKGVYPYIWTGESIFEVLGECVDRNLYEICTRRSSSSGEAVSSASPWKSISTLAQ